tara:strand:+ start:189 stop:734 length:546 start_codon:yes stop_codon:yes gene_type:complete
MGTKISALTTTGSAPTGSYLPLAFEGGNYKVSAGDLGLGGAGQKLGVYTEGTQSVPYNVQTDIVAGGLGTFNIARVSFAFTLYRDVSSQPYYGSLQGTIQRTYYTTHGGPVSFAGVYGFEQGGTSTKNVNNFLYLGKSNPSSPIYHQGNMYILFEVIGNEIKLRITNYTGASITIWYSYLA